MPREIIVGRDNEPYTQKTDLGWSIIGNVSRSRLDLKESEHEPTHRTVAHSSNDFKALDSKTYYFTLRTTAKELINLAQVRQMVNWTSERKSTEHRMSPDDKKFMQKMKQGIHQGEDGHYEMPLPFREEQPRMPNNRSLAIHRLTRNKNRLENHEQCHNDYVAFMNDMIERKYTEQVSEKEGELGVQTTD